MNHAFPCENNNTLAVNDKVYQQYGVETFSDLAKISENLVFGAEHEFFDRQDGYEGLVEKYSLKFKGEPKKMNVSLKYQAIGNGDMDVTDAFANGYLFAIVQGSIAAIKGFGIIPTSEVQIIFVLQKLSEC